MGDKNNSELERIKKEYPKFYTALNEVAPLYELKSSDILLETTDNGLSDTRTTPFLGKIRLSTHLHKLMSIDEIKSIIAHELSHVSHRDFLWLPLQFILTFLLLILMLAIIFGIGVIPYAAMIMFIVTSKIMSPISIRNEFRADKEAVSNTKNKNAMEGALNKYYSEVDKKKVLLHEKIIRKFFRTHPSCEERVKHIRTLKENP